MKNKRGLSPVIATVLLIALVVVIGLIVFFWLKGMTEESITKFDGTNIKLVCADVMFDAEYSSNTLYISNMGNVPIYKIKVKIEGSGGHTTKTISTGWPDLGLNQGEGFSGSEISGYINSGDTITIIPVLIGSTKGDEKKSYACEEAYGKKISIP